MQKHKAKGRVVYNPKRNMTKDTKWWCVLELPTDELPRYCRNVLDKEWWTYDSSPEKRKYHRPPHRAHISIIRGETPRKNHDHWNMMFKGHNLEFEYDLDIKQTKGFKNEIGEYWYINTVFPEYNLIRAHFGLDTSRNGQPFRGHLTFARCY